MKRKHFIRLSWYEVMHQLFLIVVGLLAGHFVVVQITRVPLAELMRHFYYYTSVLPSAIIAYLLCNYVYFITSKLNNKATGFKLDRHRICKQLVYGFGGAILLELICAVSLFLWKGENMLAGPYFAKLFIMILMFIALLNLVYCIYYAKVTIDYADDHPVMKFVEKEIIKFKYRRPKAVITDAEPEGIPFIIYTVQKTPQAVDARGEFLYWKKNLDKSMESLPAQDYFKIHRSFIIHRNVVQDIEPYQNDLLKIIPIFKFKYDLEISRRQTAKFQKWYYETVPKSAS